jgi:ribosomal protein L37AE/L43A
MIFEAVPDVYPDVDQPDVSAALTAMKEIADVMLNGGLCPNCGELGDHERSEDQGWNCRACQSVFAFQVV